MKPLYSKKIIVLIGVLGIILLGMCWFFKDLLIGNLFSTDYLLDGPSGVYSGINGNRIIIDAGKKVILLLNNEGQLENKIICGANKDNAPYYASLAAQGADGSIYVADVRNTGRGNLIGEERIFKYDKNGKNSKLLYTIKYDDPDTQPLQYGNILSMSEKDGNLVLTVRTKNGLEVQKIDTATGHMQAMSYNITNHTISDADVLTNTMQVVFVNRKGQLCSINDKGQADVLINKGRTSWMLCASGSQIYYTDLATNSVLQYDMVTGIEQEAFHGDDTIYAVHTNGNNVYATDYVGYYTLDNKGLTYTTSMPLSKPIVRMLLWAALCVGVLLILICICLLLLSQRPFNRKNETFKRIIIVLFVSIFMGTLVSVVSIDSTLKTQQQSVMNQIDLFSDILMQSIDVPSLEKIQNLSDYQGQHYNKIKEPLDKLTLTTYNTNSTYYYIIYMTDGKTIYGVMDYEDTLTTRHPMYAYGTEIYTEAFSQGTTQEVMGEASSYGAWSFVIKPIVDKHGATIASLEVGVNLDSINAENKKLSNTILLTIISAAVVLVIIMIEAIFYLEYRSKNKSFPHNAQVPVDMRFPLRTLLFITFLADCMQDAFISILANQRYVPIFGIPQSVGAAIPISAQVLLTALFAFAGGFITRKLGVKKILLFGFALQVSGSLVCGLGTDYLSLLLGKCIVGAGMGLIIVGTNSVAAGASSQEESGHAFAAISAGTVAGVTGGVGVGSIILSIGDFSSVYFAGAGVALLAIPLIFLSKDFKDKELIKANETSSLIKFATDRKIVTFLILALLPFLLALSYREYFFPLFAAETGMNEATIGRIYLACGIITIYIGPALTSKLMSLFGVKNTVALASLFIAMSPLLFVIWPTIAAASIGLLILSISLSFGYASQYTYFSGLSSVAKYGESKAMGVYSLFDNIGQTLGPMVYGTAMIVGYRKGLLTIGVALIMVLFLFLLFNKDKRFFKRKEEG